VNDDAPLAPTPYEPGAALADSPSDAAALPHSKVDHSHLPPLFRDRSFYGLTLTQFLGAFNDNLFKQMMLLLGISLVAGSADKQGTATMVFSLPFVLFSGFAGYLSDRFSKRTIIVCAKVAEIVIMLLGMIGFLMFGVTGYNGLLCVLFLMGTHSAFFGPGKYGILPELFRGSDLPRANGIVVMTTFLAIIFGTATAGILEDLLVDHTTDQEANATRLWLASLTCIGIAIVGTLASLTIRPTPRAVPGLKFRLSSLFIPPDTRAVLWNDRPLMMAIFASSMFWLVASMTVQVVNYVAKKEMHLDPARADTLASALNALTALGIAGGAALAGMLSRGKINFRIANFGLWGLIVCLCLLGMYRDDGTQLLRFGGSVPLMILLGVFAACFAIPVQVFIQARPKDDQKGRIIAVMNLANFAAMLISGALYVGFDSLMNRLAMPHAPIFILTALLILPLALFYRPKNVELES
jgi:MFS family permease